MREYRKRGEDKSIAWLLVHAARMHRNRLGLRLAAEELVAGQEQALKALAANGPLSIGELAATLCVRPPTASKTVSRLSSLGLVKRLPAGREDSRIIHVALTDAGEAKVQQVNRLWLETEAELVAGFDGKDRKRLRKLLRRTIKNLSGPETHEEAEEDNGKEQTPDDDR